jgi:ribonuclease HI
MNNSQSLGGKLWEMEKLLNLCIGIPDKTRRTNIYGIPKELESSIILVTDGSFKLEDNSAGGAMIVLNKQNKQIDQYNERDINFSQKFKFKSSNAASAELYSVILSLIKIPENTTIDLFTDCKYILKVVENIMNTKKIIKSLKNSAAILCLKTVIQDKHLKIIGHHVKGHRGVFVNELADKMANEGRMLEETIDEHSIIVNILKNTDYIFSTEENIDKSLEIFYKEKKIEKLSNRPITNRENTENIYQIDSQIENIHFPTTLAWTKLRQTNQMLYFKLLKAQMNGDFILEFGKEIRCPRCKRNSCSKKHWYIDCPEGQKRLSELVKNINTIPREFGINKLVILDWNLEDAKGIWEISKETIIVDPRGIFYKQCMEELQERIGKKEVMKLAEKIQTKLSELAEL